MATNFFASNNIALEDDRVWFVPYCDSVLCCYSLKEREMVYIKILPVSDNNEGKFRNLILHQNYVILIPAGADCIYVFNKTNEQLETIRFSDSYVDDKFYASYIDKNILYVFPGKESFVFVLDLDTFETDRIEIPKELIEGDMAVVNLRFASCIVNNKVVLLKYSEKIIAFFDLNDSSWIVKRLETSEGYYCTVDKFSDVELLLTDDSGNVLIYHMVEERIEKITNSVVGYVPKRFSSYLGVVSDTVKAGAYVWLFPGLANKFVRFSIKDRIIEDGFIDININKPIVRSMEQLFSKTIEYGGKVYAFFIPSCVLVEIDLEEQTINPIEIKYSDSCKRELKDYVEIAYKRGIVVEGHSMGGDLELYISCLLGKNT